MPISVTSPGYIYVPFGHPDSSSLFINEIEYDSWESFKFVKKLNQMGSFEIRLAGIESSDRTNIAEGNIVKIFNEYFLIFKGRIERVEYEQDFYVTVKGFGMEFDLTNYEVTREEYVSTNTTTIVKELISTNMDGSSPWIVNEGVNTDWGDITLKGEYDNRLRYLSNLAETVGFDWWVSQAVDGTEELDTGLYSTANDYFHIDTRKGSSSSVKTFYTGGDNQNATIVNREVDKENMCNYVNILGYGEGVNQVTASFYNASTVTTTLNETLTFADGTITLLDASNFPTSGTVRIESELVKYTGKSSNDLTGCTRGSTQATSKAHPTGIFVEKHFALADAEVGSSIGDNGVSQRTFERRDLISQQAAQCLASDMLFKLKDPIERIYLTLDDVRFTGVEIGDNVTINDVDLGLNTVYRIVGMERGNTIESGEYLTLECSNQSVSVMEDLADTTRRSDVETKYAMGTMTAENLSEKENIDATHHLTMSFYLPADIIRVNKALLSFKQTDYRAYTEATQTSENNTELGESSVSSAVGAAAIVTSYSGWMSLSTYTCAASTSLEACEISWAENSTFIPFWYARIYNNTDGIAYPDNGAIFLQTAPPSYITAEGTFYLGPKQAVIHVPKNVYNKSLTAQIQCQGTVNVGSSVNWFGSGLHTHSITTGYGITEEALTGPTCTVYVGSEGSEVSVFGTTTTDMTGYDITSTLSSAYIADGVGWYDIAFHGNKRMRIEANCFLKYFIESKA